MAITDWLAKLSGAKWNAPDGSTVTSSDVAGAFAAQGVPTAVWEATLYHEDNALDPAARKTTAREDSFGLFQLNRLGGVGALYSPDVLVNPLNNAKIAAAKMRDDISAYVLRTGDKSTRGAMLAVTTGDWPGGHDPTSQATKDRLATFDAIAGAGNSNAPASGGGLSDWVNGLAGGADPFGLSGGVGAAITKPVTDVVKGIATEALWVLVALVLVVVGGLWIAASTISANQGASAPNSNASPSGDARRSIEKVAVAAA